MISAGIQLSRGITAAGLPSNTCSAKVEENKLKYIRKIVSKDGRFPAEKFKDLAEFQEAVYKADRGRVVLVKEADSGEGKKAF